MRPEKAVISHKRKENHPPLLPLLADEVLVYLSPMVNPVDALCSNCSQCMMHVDLKRACNDVVSSVQENPL
jgi:hypothetical protein